MADPLLTSLCSICHVSAPKYKCPRCGFRTCSLACTKKHKSWSSCSGQRDPTKYVPRAQLRTAAGIDHDYNFLHGLERSVELAERTVVAERGLVREEELRPLTVQEVRWKRGRDGGRPRKVVVTRLLAEAKGRRLDKFLAQRLRNLGVTMLFAPSGMERMKENRTTLNRKTKRVHWQVEWLTFTKQRDGHDEGDGTGGAESNGDGRVGHGPTARTLSKVMDDVPLYQAYQNLADEAKGKGKKATPPRTRSETQASPAGTWGTTLDALQDPFTGRWIGHREIHSGEWPSRREDILRGRYRFFLARPYGRSDQPRTVTPLAAGDNLRTILANTRVLEFPSLYVLHEGEALPPGFALGPKDETSSPRGVKRKEWPEARASEAAKRNRPYGNEENDGGSDSQADGSKGAAGGHEAGEVTDEHSCGEDEDETSSEGSGGEDGGGEDSSSGGEAEAEA